MGAVTDKDRAVLLSAERLDKPGALAAVGDPPQYPVCYTRRDDGDPLAEVGKRRQASAPVLARGDAEFSVLSAGSAVVASASAYRYAHAPEDLYVHLDDSHVQGRGEDSAERQINNSAFPLYKSDFLLYNAIAMWGYSSDGSLSHALTTPIENIGKMGH